MRLESLRARGHDARDMDLRVILIGSAAALLVGVAKSGVPGLGILVVPVLALAFPARASTGALLPMLLTGDVLAIFYYHRHAQWRDIRKLVPWVAGGMAAAAWVLTRIDDATLKPLLGGIVLAMLALEGAVRGLKLTRVPHHPLVGAGAGVTAGFATTVGNAAGPVMNIYLLAKGLPKEQFLGTAAWFFFLVNATKVPIFVWQGMITRQSLLFDLAMAPLVLVGAFLGFRLVSRIPQKRFYLIVFLLTLAAGLNLLLR